MKQHGKRKRKSKIPDPKTKQTYRATAALEKKLREAKNSKEVDCPPDFFTEPLDD